MNKLSLRMRITFMTGLIVFIVSVTSMFLSTYYANSAISEAVLVTNTYYYDNVIDDTYLVADYSAEDATEASTESERQSVDMVELTPAEKISDIEEQTAYVDDNYIQYIRDNYQMMELLISLGASVIGMILAYYFSTKMLEPLHDLSTTMLSVSHNNLNRKLPETENDDEIGNLTFAFNKMTERLNNQFSRQKDFSSNVAHELRTPLSIMKMSYQVIDEDTTISEFHHTKKLNEKQVDNLIRICDDLLVFANDEEIKEKEVVNLDELINMVLEDQKLLIKDKSINIVKNVDDTIAVLANKRLVYQLLSNLINNSIKYNLKNGTVYLIVQKENQNITLIVADNGIGIEESSLEHIFEPFYRENKSRSRKTGGTGLGLSIVKQIVDQHGWEIEVESVKNQKTMFTITI